LALFTQASNKVYRSKRDKQPVVQRLEAHVSAGGLLVVAPDALVPFAESSYEQRHRFCLASSRKDSSWSEGGVSRVAHGAAVTGSAVVVDWVGAGRVGSGERWDFDSYFSRSEYCSLPGDVGATACVEGPWLVEALALGRAPGEVGPVFHDAALGMGRFDAAVSVVAVGPRARGVAHRLHAAAAALARRSGARVVGPSVESFSEAFEGTGGRVVEGLALPELDGDLHLSATDTASPAAAAAGAATVGRIVAERTDDVYRLLHACLEPLAGQLGAVPYAERIHGSGSGRAARGAARRPASRRTQRPRAIQFACTSDGTSLTMAQQMALMQLTDATLPSGSFAHSAGIEAAHQLGILGRLGHTEQGAHAVAAVRSFVLAAARSGHRLHGAFAAAAHEAVCTEAGSPASLERWKALDAELHAHLAGNAVACRASLQQGAAMARALAHWEPAAEPAVPLPRPLRGHAATVFGLAGARLGLPRPTTLAALAHCGVRDAVSAAVRLGLLGPLRGVELQAGIVQELASELLLAPNAGVPGVQEAAGSAPLVDCAHAAHDLLHARLFVS